MTATNQNELRTHSLEFVGYLETLIQEVSKRGAVQASATEPLLKL